MVNFAFVATLFSFLPSFIAVAVELDLIGPSFQKYSTEVPLTWSDGEVRLKDGKVVISLGEKSNLLVYSEGKMSKYLSDMKETVELSEPNISITIITKKDKYDFGEVIDTYSPSDDVATLKTIQREYVTRGDDAENFQNTEDAFNSTDFRDVSDPDLESFLALESNAYVEDEVETNNLINLFSNETNMNDIGTDLLFKEARDQDILNNDFAVHEDRTEVGNGPKGQQFKMDRYDEPMIYISNGVVPNPQCVSSLTGKIHQLKTKKREPFTGKYRIPDEIKLLIVNEGDSKKYYKNIIKGSKVWYLRRDEKAFYPCIIEIFSQRNPKPTLECIGLEPQLVPEVSWDDIFPIESSELINDLGRFAVKIEDINWDDLSKKKETDMAIRADQKTPEASIKGQQFKMDRFDEPMISASIGLVQKPQFVSSLTGKIFQLITKKLEPFTGNYRIPDETKLLIVNEGDSKKYYKNIIKGSKVWYLRRDEKAFYPCIIEIFSQRNPKPTLECIGLEPQLAPEVSWDDIFPIESSELINDLGRFAVKIEDIKWDDLSKKKETKMTILEERKTPEASKALPCKRKKNIKEKARKEHRINMETQ